MIEYVGQSTEGFVPVNFDKYSPYANVRCVKLYQSENVTKTAAEVALVTWLNETDFIEDIIPKRMHNPLGGREG